jgi:hypothetical protein
VVRHGPSRCLGTEEAWASSSCSVLTLCVSDGVGLDQPPSGETFWSLLGGKGGQLWRLMHGPGSPRAPEALESFVFLCHAPGMTLSEKQLVGACLGSNARKHRASVAWGLSSCARALASIICWAGAKGRDRDAIDQSPRLGVPPSPRKKLQLSQAQPGLLARGRARACPMGIAPEAPGNPEGVGQGVFFVWEPLDPRLNIPLC